MKTPDEHPKPPHGMRMTIRETPDGLGIHVPAERNWQLIAFLLMWLGGWAIGETFAIATLVTSGDFISNAFLILWLALWTVGGFFALWIVLWQFYGTERLFITGGALVHAAGVGPVTKQKVYPLDQFGAPRIDVIGAVKKYSTPRKSQPPIKAIVFDGSEHMVRFGAGMNDQERAYTLAVIRRYLPKRADAEIEHTQSQGA